MNVHNAPGLPENQNLFPHRNFRKEASSELEQIVLLGRLGQYQEADFCFQAYLRDHLDQFSTVSEYADFLLEQRSYGQLGQFSRDRLTHYLFGPNENQLLDLSVSLSDLYLYGSRREAGATARLFWNSLASQISEEPDSMSNTLVQSLVQYLEIVTLVNGTLFKVEDGYTHPPWLSAYGCHRWLGFRDWCLSLARGPRLWEAKIFNLLLPVLSAVDASDLYLELQEAFRRHQARFRLSVLQSTAYTQLGNSRVEILSIFLQQTWTSPQTGHFSGQFWNIRPVGSDDPRHDRPLYVLATMYLGASMVLTAGASVRLASYQVDGSGWVHHSQHWRISEHADGTYNFTAGYRFEGGGSAVTLRAWGQGLAVDETDSEGTSSTTDLALWRVEPYWTMSDQGGFWTPR